MTARSVEPVGVDGIVVGNRLRSLNDAAVETLRASIAQIGLRSPITIRVDRTFDDHGNAVDETPILIAGAHRLEAAKRLGWDFIDAYVFEGDERDARMWEIAENLHRADLTALERAEQVAEWVRLAEERGLSRQLDEKMPRGRPESGRARASREIGVSEPQARRAEKIDSLAPEAKEAAIAAGLDKNQSALLDAAKAETADAQVRVIEQKARQAEQMKAERRAKDKAARHQDVKDAKSDALETAARIIADDVRPENIPALASALALRGDRELAARIQALTGAVFDNSRLGEAA